MKQSYIIIIIIIIVIIIISIVVVVVAFVNIHNDLHHKGQEVHEYVAE